MGQIIAILLTALFVLSGCSASLDKEGNAPTNEKEYVQTKYEYLESHPLVESARKQIGMVTSYDTSYYNGGYPPEDRGACTDVIERALRDNGYDLKAKIDEDMHKYPEQYPHESDPNINYRRVRNVKVFLDHYAEKIPTCINKECFDEGYWQPGDIVTFDQIPGSLWHIAIVSNKVQVNEDGTRIPFLIHNYARGVVEDNKLLTWPAPISGHYRLSEISLTNIPNDRNDPSRP